MAKHRNPLPTPEEKAERKRARNMEKGKKIAVAIAAIALVVAAFFGYSSFFGNPFSRMTAEKNIQAYIAEEYPSLDLELSAVKYDRESGWFYATASSPTSVDTHFSVYSKNAEVRDYYKDSVTDLFNTIERIEDAFSAAAKTAIADETAEVTVAVLDFINARESGAFKVDMPVSTDIEAEFAVYLTVEKTASLEAIAKTATELKKALDLADMPKIALYNVTLVEGDKTASAQNIPTEDITDGLGQKLAYALENPANPFGDSENPRPLRVSIQ